MYDLRGIQEIEINRNLSQVPPELLDRNIVRNMTGHGT